LKTENKLPKEVAEMMAMQDQAMSTMGAMIAQLQRLLYAAVNQAPGRTLEIKEAELDPLWRLDKIRKEDGTLVLTASLTPPPTQEQMMELADKLRGTNTRLEELQKKDTAGIGNWPTLYLVGKLAPYVLWSEDRWRDTALVKGAETPTGQN